MGEGADLMTKREDRPDLAAIAREAAVELGDAALAGGRREEPSGSLAASVAELGYYEAELRSLHDAAIALEEAEHRSGPA
jgi:hypothetical protein